MYRIGLSTCGKQITENLFKDYKNSGICLMEITVDNDKYDEIDYKKIFELSKKYGIELWSYHFPFAPFTKLDISNNEICKQTIEYFNELMKKAADIGIDKFIIHPSGEPIEDDCRHEKMKCAKESLFNLAELAEKQGVVIAVEDLPRSCLGKNSKEIKELVGVHDSLKVCFDTNHLLSENPIDFINEVGDRIITTHISDFDFINERHWLPGEGKINWREVLEALQKTGYKGPWLYEISFECPKTIIRNRELNCEDFVLNAGEVFNNKEITLFSSQKQNLGMWE